MSEQPTGIDEMAAKMADEIIEGISMRPPPRTISVEEAGRILGISRMAAYNAVWRGQIPYIRIGHRLLVPVAKLNEMAPPVDGEQQATE